MIFFDIILRCKGLCNLADMVDGVKLFFKLILITSALFANKKSLRNLLLLIGVRVKALMFLII